MHGCNIKNIIVFSYGMEWKTDRRKHREGHKRFHLLPLYQSFICQVPSVTKSVFIVCLLTMSPGRKVKLTYCPTVDSYILCVLWTVWITNDIVCILSRLQWNFPRFHIISLRRFLISLRTRTKFYPSIIFMNILYISSKYIRFEYNKLELRFTYLRQLLTTNFQ